MESNNKTIAISQTSEDDLEKFQAEFLENLKLAYKETQDENGEKETKQDF